MYYKTYSYSDLRCYPDFNEIYSNEFVVALYEKYKKHYGENVKIGFIDITDNKTNETSRELVVVLKNKTHLESLRLEQYKKLGSFKSLNDRSFTNSIDNFEEINIEKGIKSYIKDFSEEFYEKAKKELSNYFNIVKKGQITDKSGNLYEYNLIENADNSIGSNVVVDELLIRKNNEDVGYIKIKYSNLEIDEECSKIPYSILNKKNFTLEEKKFYLNRQKIEFQENNVDVLFKLLQADTREALKKYNKDPQNKLFNNIATVDYSRIYENFQGLGIGKEMYLIMGEHLKLKNIIFRSSSLRSESAKGLWNKLKREHPDMIKEQKINNDVFFVLDFIENPKKNKKLIKNKTI